MNRFPSSLIVCLAIVFFLAGCGEFEVEDQPLQGTIDGEPWTYSAGSAEESFSNEDELRVNIFADTETPCEGALGPDDADDRRIISTFPSTPGEYDLGFGDDELTITFTYPDDGDGPPRNMIATSGKLVIDMVTDEYVRGGLGANFDSDHQVNGNFELTRCDNVD